MKLIAQVKLKTTEEQAKSLRETLEAANAACDWLSEEAWNSRVFGQWSLHKAHYQAMRSRFGLSAQIAVRAIAKVADAYKLDKKTKRTFRPHGSIAYDDRILSWNLASKQVSISTLHGRIKVPFVCGERQQALLESRQGETDLVYRDGCFYLLAVCNVVEPDPIDVDDVLGIDLGIKNIAVDSDGNRHTGAVVNALRKRHRKLRKRLQAKQTKSARRLLKKRRLKEQRFATDVNHCISKKIVRLAQRTERGIALEELAGIRSRIRVKRPQRAAHSSWAFGQLRAFVTYKATLSGIPVLVVDPRHTSQRCSSCGHTEKANRPNQETFCCRACGLCLNADSNAAQNIRVLGRAVVNPPNASSLAA